MKLNRSAIILAIAIVLLIVALFVVRNSNEGYESEILTNASNATDIYSNATNATQAIANATMPTGNATSANATLEPQTNATVEGAQTGKAQANATAEAEKQAKAKEEKLAKEKAAKEKAAKEKAAKEKAAKEKAAKEKAEQTKKDKTDAVVTAPATPTTPATPKATKPSAKPSKGAPPTAAVISQLNDFGSRRITLINSSIRPGKSSREVSKQGNEYVARYYYVSPSSLRTEASPADSSAPFIYVGKVRYQESLYECKAASKEEAMRGEGQVIQSRNMLELIRYTNKWVE